MRNSFWFPLYLSGRLRLAASGTRRVSAAVAAGVAGIGLAVAVMLLTVAVTAGFQREIRGTLTGFDAPVSLMPLSRYYGDAAATITYGGGVRKGVERVMGEGGMVATGAIRQAAILKTPDDFLGVVLRGYAEPSEGALSLARERVVEGEFPDYDAAGAGGAGKADTSSDIVISALQASRLKLGVGDKVTAYFVVGEAVKARRLRVAAIYDSHFADYDEKVAYASYGLLDGVALAGTANDTGAQSLELRFKEGSELAAATPEEMAERLVALQSTLNGLYAGGELEAPVAVDGVVRSAAGYFNWLGLLDMNVAVVVVLMASVSGFTLVASLFTLVLERVRLIGLLSALGATGSQMRGAFLLLGGRVALFGLLIGDVLALVLIFVQGRWHVVLLDAATYYLPYVPVHLSWGGFVAVNLGAMVLAALLALIPTAVVSRIRPAQTLRYQ